MWKGGWEHGDEHYNLGYDQPWNAGRWGSSQCGHWQAGDTCQARRAFCTTSSHGAFDITSFALFTNSACSGSMTVELCLLSAVARSSSSSSFSAGLSWEWSPRALVPTLDVSSSIFCTPHWCQLCPFWFRVLVQGLVGAASWTCPHFFLFFLRLSTPLIPSAFCRPLVWQLVSLIGVGVPWTLLPKTTSCIPAGPTQSLQLSLYFLPPQG